VTRCLLACAASIAYLAGASSARAQPIPELDLPTIDVQVDPAHASGVVVFTTASATVACDVADDRAVVVCAVRQTYVLTGAHGAAVAGAVRAVGDAEMGCRRADRERERPVDCAGFALGPDEELTVELRAERRFVPRFARRWIHDPAIGVAEPHGAHPIPTRHLLTSRDGGFGRVAPVTLVFPPPRGATEGEGAWIALRLEREGLFDGRWSVERFGRHRGYVLDGTIRAAVLGGPTLAIGGVLRSGVAVRGGYEVGFGRHVPAGLEVAYEWSPDRGHGFSTIVFASSDTPAGFGGAIGLGPAFRFVDGDATAGARLAFDVMLASVHLLTLLTFEWHTMVSAGFYLGLTL
jgi:hypothetical protein